MRCEELGVVLHSGLAATLAEDRGGEVDPVEAEEGSLVGAGGKDLSRSPDRGPTFRHRASRRELSTDVNDRVGADDCLLSENRSWKDGGSRCDEDIVADLGA